MNFSEENKLFNEKLFLDTSTCITNADMVIEWHENFLSFMKMGEEKSVHARVDEKARVGQSALFSESRRSFSQFSLHFRTFNRKRRQHSQPQARAKAEFPYQGNLHDGLRPSILSRRCLREGFCRRVPATPEVIQSHNLLCENFSGFSKFCGTKLVPFVELLDEYFIHDCGERQRGVQSGW